MISPEEHRLLSEYSKSELVGAIILADFARRTKDDYLRAQLTIHAAEEAVHARYWVDLLKKFNLLPLEVHDSEGRQYFAKTGIPKDEIELLALTEALEIVAPKHLEAYASVPDTHPEIIKVIEKLTQEEKGHKGWVSSWLDANKSIEAVTAAREKFSSIMKAVYDKELERLESQGGRLRDIAVMARERMVDG